MNAVALILGYLLGSIPFGFLIVKIASGADIRETGSGGTGATNVTRKAGKGAGIVTLIFDALKGVAAVMVARMLTDEDGTSWVVAGAGVLAVVGHCFPVWLKFKAGKGVATGLGVFLAVVPWAVMAACIVFLVVVWRTRFISLGSILAAAFVPLWVWGMHTWLEPISNLMPIMAALCASSAIIIAKHHENIQRLMAGTENKFGAAK
ncbi:MAG TPA: glycerol-3-phosphate 1-O-acyltransferase PlsY [Blastocatellia bacterium]|nr:glycerol-3-phosphate 1-O-acyltransferase PlsY [Blastocatellia bacterium]